MSILSAHLERAQNDAAVDYRHIYVGGGDEGGDEGGESQPVLAGKQYVQVWLRSWHIGDTGPGNVQFYPVVFSQFAYSDSLQGTRELTSVVAPGEALPNRASEDTVLFVPNRFNVVNQPLLGPTPYLAGLTMGVALFSVFATNLAEPYLNLLTDLTRAASIAYLSRAKPFMESLRWGAERLLYDAKYARLEIGYVHAGAELRTGNLLVAGVTRGANNRANHPENLRPENLRVDPHDFSLLDRRGQPIKDFPYIILGVEASAERADYAAIPELSAGWEATRLTAVEGGSISQVRERFEQLRRAIWLSPDLTQADKKRCDELFSREISDAQYAMPPLGGAQATLPPLRPLRDAPTIFESFYPPSTPLPASAMEAGPESGRISMQQLQEIMANPDIPDAELKRYFIANPDTSRPYSPAIIPDPARVEVAVPTDAFEGIMAMNFANALYRLRRQKKFNQRRAQGIQQVVLVSEGDSWFLFPIFLDDVIDQLFDDFNIWSVDAAGDTLQNMVLDNAEYLRALRRNKDDVRAFLFSGGGNDIVGVDELGKPIVSQLVKRFEPGRSAEWYLDTDEFAAKLRFIESCYRDVISNVSEEFNGLPVICHGYDYAIPGGGPGDTRNPLWAARDQWIGRALRVDLGITDHQLQTAIVHMMIDRFNERLKSLCGGNNPNGAFRNAWHVDIRGTVGMLWADEIHPTNAGFRLAAAKFREILNSALG